MSVLFIVVVLTLAIGLGILIAHMNATTVAPDPEQVRQAKLRALYTCDDPYSPEHEDLGQHDVWKRVFRDVYTAGHVANLDPTLATVLRKQDYMRFASAACPGETREALLKFLQAHERAVEDEALARYTRNMEAARIRPGMTYPSVEETIEIQTWIATNPSTQFAPLNPLP